MSFHTRCKRCDHRQALSKPISHYIRQPVCRVCQGELRPDRWMNQRNTKAMTCTCDGHGPGYHYPHRRGSVWCCYQPNGEWKTADQFAAEQAILAEESA